MNNLLTFIHSFILTRTYSSVYWVQEQCIHTWFNLNCSSTVGVWHWVDYTPATQVRRRLRASSQRELIETDLNWNINNLSDSSCSTIIPGSGSESAHFAHARGHFFAWRGPNVIPYHPSHRTWTSPNHYPLMYLKLLNEWQKGVEPSRRPSVRIPKINTVLW